MTNKEKVTIAEKMRASFEEAYKVRSTPSLKEELKRYRLIQTHSPGIFVKMRCELIEKILHERSLKRS